MVLFTVKIEVEGEQSSVDCESVVACIEDQRFADLLNRPGVSCVLWCGDLRLNGRPLETARELHELLVANARVILRQLL